jgi:hypothetical protein
MKLPRLFTWLAVIVAPVWVTAAPAARPPNIIFIVADDLGYGDIGPFGQKLIRTPNLDRLAAQGMRLTQHYSGNNVCAPSRCVLMTGLHPGHAFIRDNREMKPEGQFPIPADTVTLPKLLQQRGYATGGFGKWGLGGPGTAGVPLRQGFDRWYGVAIARPWRITFTRRTSGTTSARSRSATARSPRTRSFRPVPTCRTPPSTRRTAARFTRRT